MESYFRELKHSSHAVLHRHQASQCSICSWKHSSHQRAPITDTESWGGKQLFQMPEKDTEPVGRHRALLQDAGHTLGSAWQRFLSAGAWYHTMTADQPGCYDHQVKCPSSVTLNETKISQFSTNWVSGQETWCRARYGYHRGNTSELITEWNSEKVSKLKIRGQTWKIKPKKNLPEK